MSGDIVDDRDVRRASAAGEIKRRLEAHREPAERKARQTLDAGDRIEPQAGENDQKTRFAKLVLPYLSDAYALARSLTGNHIDAEDVVQEACLRAYRAINSVADQKARAWLLTIVYNTSCTWLGRNRSRAVVVTVDDLEIVERAQPRDHDAQTPETVLIAKTDGALLEAAIAALPVAYRETLLLRELEGLDYRQIAEITGVPIGTVMSRLARARRRVIAALAERTP